jgi:hypothetical protein
MVELLLKDHELFVKSNYRYPKFIYTVKPFEDLKKGIIELTNFNYAKYKVEYRFIYFDVITHTDKKKEGTVKLAWKSYTFNEAIKNVTDHLVLTAPTITDEFKRELWKSTSYNRVCKVQGRRLEIEGQDIGSGLLKKGANLSQSSFHGCYAFDCSVEDIDFSYADLSGMNFTRVVFNNCNFKGANFKNIQINDCLFNDCNPSNISSINT